MNYRRKEEKEQESKVMKMEGTRGTDSAEVIKVIRTTALKGTGTKEDMSRIVTQYWSLEGELLAENDPCKK